MYSKFGRSKWILVGQMLKLVRNGQWPAAISSTDEVNIKETGIVSLNTSWELSSPLLRSLFYICFVTNFQPPQFRVEIQKEDCLTFSI